MEPYETSATVAERGALKLGGVSFPPGTLVEVSISPKETPISSKKATYDELDEVYASNQTQVHGSEALKPETIQNARRFIDALSPELPAPTVGSEPDGHVTLEWYRATDWLLSVSVSPEGALYWAAVLGDEDPRGSCRFEDEVPQTIVYWIRRVCSL